MPKVIQMPRRRRSSVQVAPRKETPAQEGVTSILIPSASPEQDAALQQYEKLAEIALSKPPDKEIA